MMTAAALATDNETALADAFVASLGGNDAFVNVTLARDAWGGWCLRATHDAAPFSDLLHVPDAHTLVMGHHADATALARAGCSARGALAAHAAREALRGAASPHAAWIRMWPRETIGYLAHTPDEVSQDVRRSFFLPEPCVPQCLHRSTAPRPPRPSVWGRPQPIATVGWARQVARCGDAVLAEEHAADLALARRDFDAARGVLAPLDDDGSGGGGGFRAAVGARPLSGPTVTYSSRLSASPFLFF